MSFHTAKLLAAGVLAAASFAAGAQTLLTKIPLPSPTLNGWADVAVDPATNRIYVPLQFGAPPNEDSLRVLVFDGASNEVVHSLSNFSSGTEYVAIGIDQVRNFIYVEVAHRDSSCSVVVVDGETEQIVKAIQLGRFNCGKMAVDSLTGKVYIREYSALAVIESEATGKIETFSLPAFSEGTENGLAVSPYIHRLYFTSSQRKYSETLGFFDTDRDQISQTTTICSGIDAAANPVINQETGNIFGSSYDTSLNSDSISVYNSKGGLLAKLALPAIDASSELTGSTFVSGIDVDPGTNLAFVSAFTIAASAEGSALFVIDGTSDTVLSSALLSSPARQFLGGKVAVNPGTGRVYVIDYNPTNSTFYVNVYSEK